MKNTHAAIAAISLAAVLALPLASPGFAGTGQPDKPADLPQKLEANFKAWAGKCSQCHDPERAYSAKYDDADAIKGLVARMSRKTNAAIGRDDQKKIIAYLTWYHSRTAAR